MYTCIRTRRPDKVIVGARSTLSYDVCLHGRAWEDRLLYKVYERRPRSQCVVEMAVSGCMLNHLELYR